jgi:hypothetical protein
MYFAPPAPEAAAAVSQSVGLAVCRFRRDGDNWAGSCGPVFDETPSFSLQPAKTITTGVWRRGLQPRAVWAGKLSSAGDPDFPVELEVYDHGEGVLRSEFGWHAITGYALTAATLSFRMDAAHELAPNALDRAILERARGILSSEAVWNRADNRKCAPAATTWSLYCACQKATMEVTGGFHHRRPALELVREIVEKRTVGRTYSHRLMDYNNDPSTTLADVQAIFSEALRRIPR